MRTLANKIAVDSDGNTEKAMDLAVIGLFKLISENTIQQKLT